MTVDAALNVLQLVEYLGISVPFQRQDDDAGVDKGYVNDMVDLKHFANEPTSSVTPAPILIKRVAHIYDQLMQGVELSVEVYSENTRYLATLE